MDGVESAARIPDSPCAMLLVQQGKELRQACTALLQVASGQRRAVRMRSRSGGRGIPLFARHLVPSSDQLGHARDSTVR